MMEGCQGSGKTHVAAGRAGIGGLKDRAKKKHPACGGGPGNLQQGGRTHDGQGSLPVLGEAAGAVGRLFTGARKAGNGGAGNRVAGWQGNSIDEATATGLHKKTWSDGDKNSAAGGIDF